MLTKEQLLDIKHFKAELSDYYFLNSKIQRLKDQKLELETSRGIQSVRYDKEPVQGSQDPSLSEIRRIEMIEKIDKIDEQIKYYTDKLNRIINYIHRSEYGASVMLIYCLGKSTYLIESKKLYMDEKTLKRRVNKEILEFLEW